MPRIEDATLTYDGELYEGVSRLIITFTIHWADHERRPDASFELNTALYGNDPSRDDLLLSEYIGYAMNGEATQEVTHTILISTDRLNEDWGRDEVYARLTIRPLPFTPVSATTNEIRGRF